MRRLVSIVLIFASVAAGRGVRAADAKPHFVVSITSLGVTGGGGATDAETLAGHLAGDGWCTAAACGADIQRPRWNKRPAQIAANEWVSVALTGFGAQAHAFVFMFDGPSGAPRLIAHVPYAQSILQSGAKAWAVPTAQIAGAFGIAYRRKAPPRALEAPVSIKVGIEEPKPGSGETAGAATVTPGEALPAMEAMLCAAVSENGLSAVFEPSAQTIDLDLHFGFKSASLRVSRRSPGAVDEVRKDGVPEDQYFAFLTRLLWMRTPNSGVTDFAWLGGAKFHLLSASAERVCGAGGAGIAAFDPRNGKRLWASPAAKIPDVFATLPPGTSDRVFRISGALASVNLEKGMQKVLASEAPGTPGAFAVREDSTALIAREETLSAFRNGTKLWRRDENARITAGPAIVGNAVFLGTADGDMVCRAADDGAEKWRVRALGEWCGDITAAGNSTIFAFTKKDDACAAVSTKDGALLWSQPVGDVLLKAPVALGAQWLVVGKNNRILLLNASDGKIAAETHWPTWLVDAIVIASGGQSTIACSDIRGRLSFLDGATLKTLGEIALPARPFGELKFAPQFPVLWGAATADADPLAALALDDTAGKLKPAVLATDADGFLYIVPVKPEMAHPAGRAAK